MEYTIYAFSIDKILFCDKIEKRYYMKIIDLKIKKLLSEIENFEKENNMPKNKRLIYDNIFENRLKNLNGQLDNDAIYSAILETKFNDADKLCFEILPQFDKDNKKEGTIFAHLFFSIMRYECFTATTRSECIAKGIKAINQYILNFKCNLDYEYYEKETYKLLNGNKTNLLKHFFQYSNVDVPIELIEDVVLSTDKYFIEHNIFTLNGAIDYHIHEMQMAKLSEILDEINENDFVGASEIEQPTPAPIIDDFLNK